MPICGLPALLDFRSVKLCAVQGSWHGAPARTPRSTRIASTIPSCRLGVAVAVSASTAKAAVSASIGSDLPRLPTGAPAGSAHLQHLHALLDQEAGQPSIVTARPLDTDRFDALAEAVNGLYKAELIGPHGPWRTTAQVGLATLTWVQWWTRTACTVRSATHPTRRTRSHLLPSAQTVQGRESPIAQASIKPNPGKFTLSCHMFPGQQESRWPAPLPPSPPAPSRERTGRL